MATVETPVSKNNLELYFSTGSNESELAKNIFISVAVPGIFPTDKLSTKFNCREHYEKQNFHKVYIKYNTEKGLYIQAYPNVTNYDRQELYIPERFIVCIGVDYESERSE